MFKKCKVVCLPTNQKSENIKHNIIGKVKKSMSDRNIGDLDFFNSWILYSEEYYQSQHLYILSDDKIKEGDWFYTTYISSEFVEPLKPQIHKCTSRKNGWCSISEIALDVVSNPAVSQKVIASTDPALNLPSPSKRFIEKYCELGGIDEANVEYELWPHTEESPQFRLKVSKDNTLTIKKCKTTWTREEVENLIRDYQADALVELDKLISTEWTSNWLSKNL